MLREIVKKVSKGARVEMETEISLKTIARCR